MEKVSVVVPIYNVENYLEKCVQSVRNQTYKNLEIILVDDGATDSCGQICDRLATEDERIKVVHKKKRWTCLSKKRRLSGGYRRIYYVHR